MQRPGLDLLRLKRWARYAWLLAVVPVIALAFAGVGAAALPGSTDLGITKTDSPDPVNVGSTLTYTIQVQNLGPDVATGVTVTDQLSKGVDFIRHLDLRSVRAQREESHLRSGRAPHANDQLRQPADRDHLRHPSQSRDDQQYRLGEGRSERFGGIEQQGHCDDSRYRPAGDLPRRPGHDDRNGGRRHHHRHGRP